MDGVQLLPTISELPIVKYIKEPKVSVYTISFPMSQKSLSAYLV